MNLETFEPFVFSKDKMGVPIHVISYNLLLNFTSAFSRMGSSEIGFLAAHNSRMQFQYGAEQEVFLPWYIWNKAVMFFWNQILDLPLEKLFICFLRNVRTFLEEEAIIRFRCKHLWNLKRDLEK